MAAAVSALLIGASCNSSPAASPVTRSPTANPAAAGCTAPEASQFDFWVGSWRGTWTDAQGAATGTDVVVRNGCEIDESFAAARFLQHANYGATSESHWDSALGRWVQDYRDNAGERSRWLGGYASGEMMLVGPQVGSRQQRILWRDIQSSGLTWEYDSSTDGTTWSTVVIVTYLRA